ncbi:unnamed protein product [Pieris brassicae]|uniref:Cuticle protein n=1 Tax=Pieris brassicae TaxID=7116 RepID=A0A9P0TH62_PIEBR|nr:unnamed protein product [Pieris brassicae]
MKAIVIVLLLATVAVYGAEEKKEKRGLLGLGYGGHGLGLYGGHSLGLYGGHGLGLYGSHGLGLYGGHAIAASPIVSHSVAIPAPIISHGIAAPVFDHGLYGHGLGAPLLGLGHGWH